jgi:hypothetical protein
MQDGTAQRNSWRSTITLSRFDGGAQYGHGFSGVTGTCIRCRRYFFSLAFAACARLPSGSVPLRTSALSKARWTGGHTGLDGGSTAKQDHGFRAIRRSSTWNVSATEVSRNADLCTKHGVCGKVDCRGPNSPVGALLRYAFFYAYNRAMTSPSSISNDQTEVIRVLHEYYSAFSTLNVAAVLP